MTDPLLDNVRKETEFTALMEVARRRHQAFKSIFFEESTADFAPH